LICREENVSYEFPS